MLSVTLIRYVIIAQMPFGHPVLSMIVLRTITISIEVYPIYDAKLACSA